MVSPSRKIEMVLRGHNCDLGCQISPVENLIVQVRLALEAGRSSLCPAVRETAL
jgi:hypothetical protein